MNEFQGIKCPKCGKKGLRYANHPHACGWKDYNRINCRYCGSNFRPPKVKPGETLRDALGANRAATNQPGGRAEE